MGERSAKGERIAPPAAAQEAEWPGWGVGAARGGGGGGQGVGGEAPGSSARASAQLGNAAPN